MDGVESDDLYVGVAGGSRETGESVDGKISKYRGVQWDKKGNKWRARLHTDRTRHVGYYDSEEVAARAWDQALLRYCRDQEAIRKLNFQDSYTKFQRQILSKEEELNLEELRGVSVTNSGKFRATIIQNRIPRLIGVYSTAAEAAQAYDWMAISYSGWGTLTNFPVQMYEMKAFENAGVNPLNQMQLPPVRPNRKIKSYSDLESLPDALPLNQNLAGNATSYATELNDLACIDGESQGMNRPRKSPRSFPVSLHSLNLSSDTMPVNANSMANPYHHGGSMVSEVIEQIGGKWCARVSLHCGSFNTADEAKAALRRAKVLRDGISQLSASELVATLQSLRPSADYASPNVVESNGSFFSILKIRERDFQIGPFATQTKAALAHCKYSLILYGMKQPIDYPLIDVLMEHEDSTILLKALWDLHSKPSTTTDEYQAAPAEEHLVAHPSSNGYAINCFCASIGQNRVMRYVTFACRGFNVNDTKWAQKIEELNIAGKAAPMQGVNLPPQLPPHASGATFTGTAMNANCTTNGQESELRMGIDEFKLDDISMYMKRSRSAAEIAGMAMAAANELEAQLGTTAFKPPTADPCPLPTFPKQDDVN